MNISGELWRVSEMALTAPERAKRYRERKKQNKESREVFLRKERERQRAHYVPISERSKRDQRKTKRQWRKNQKSCRLHRQAIQIGTQVRCLVGKYNILENMFDVSLCFTPSSMLLTFFSFSSEWITDATPNTRTSNADSNGQSCPTTAAQNW